MSDYLSSLLVDPEYDAPIQDFDPEASTSDRQQPPLDGTHAARVVFGTVKAEKRNLGDLTYAKSYSDKQGKKHLMLYVDFKITTANGDYSISEYLSTQVRNGASGLTDLLKAFGAAPAELGQLSPAQLLQLAVQYIDAGHQVYVQTEIQAETPTGQKDAAGYDVTKLHRRMQSRLQNPVTGRIEMEPTIDGTVARVFATITKFIPGGAR